MKWPSNTAYLYLHIDQLKFGYEFNPLDINAWGPNLEIKDNLRHTTPTKAASEQALTPEMQRLIVEMEQGTLNTSTQYTPIAPISLQQLFNVSNLTPDIRLQHKNMLHIVSSRKTKWDHLVQIFPLQQKHRNIDPNNTTWTLRGSAIVSSPRKELYSTCMTNVPRAIICSSQVHLRVRGIPPNIYKHGMWPSQHLQPQREPISRTLTPPLIPLGK